MQDVNNDMDDLFRKAAEQYPLKTNGDHWKKVLSGIQDTDASVPVTGNKENRKKRALWLFLLLPLGLLYAVWHGGSKQHSKQLVHNKETWQKKITDNGNSIADALREKQVTNAKQATNNITKTAKRKTSNIFTNKTNEVAKNIDNSISHSSDSKSNNIIKKDKANLPADKEMRNNQDSTVVVSLSSFSKTTTTVSSHQTINKNKNNTGEKQPCEPSNRIQNTITTDSETKNTNTIAAKQNEADSNLLKANKEDSAIAKTADNNTKKEAKIKVKTHDQKGFYGGLSGSFDASTIKLQSINKTGYSLNVLAGYRFSKRLSVETGINRSKKNYYSDGKYFDKSKTGIPDPVKIYFTNGDCKMFEVPLNVKYDFALRKKSNLYAIAGLSSYFMKKEDYSYHAIWGTWVYDTTKYYTNSGNNLFSVANFCIGYQLQLNKNSALRIEPYIKMPLRGIGIANMPIISTGVSAGFTRRF